MTTPSMTSFNNEDMARAFFGEISTMEAKTKIPCKGGCNKLIAKPKSGYTAFISHIETYHKETMMDVYNSFKQIRVSDNVRGPMDDFNPKRFASASAEKVIYTVNRFITSFTSYRFTPGSTGSSWRTIRFHSVKTGAQGSTRTLMVMGDRSVVKPYPSMSPLCPRRSEIGLNACCLILLE